jgi:hypothetical protein
MLGMKLWGRPKLKQICDQEECNKFMLATVIDHMHARPFNFLLSHLELYISETGLCAVS